MSEGELFERFLGQRGLSRHTSDDGFTPLRIVARHAEMWNSFGSPEVFRTKIARLEDHCSQVGRDPATIEKSVLLGETLPLDNARRQIDAYARVGVTHIIYSVGPAERAWVHRFGEQVIPSYRV